MRQLEIDILFDQTLPLPVLTTDHSWAADPKRFNDLFRWAVTYFRQSSITSLHQELTTLAIKCDNLLGVEILWQGLLRYQQKAPDYWFDLKTALTSGTPKMMVRVLFIYLNCVGHPSNQVLVYQEILELAALNPHPKVFQLIQSLSTCVDLEGYLIVVQGGKSDHPGDDCFDQQLQLSRRFHALMAQFLIEP